MRLGRIRLQIKGRISNRQHWGSEGESIEFLGSMKKTFVFWVSDGLLIKLLKYYYFRLWAKTIETVLVASCRLVDLQDPSSSLRKGAYRSRTAAGRQVRP